MYLSPPKIKFVSTEMDFYEYGCVIKHNFLNQTYFNKFINYIYKLIFFRRKRKKKKSDI